MILLLNSCFIVDVGLARHFSHQENVTNFSPFVCSPFLGFVSLLKRRFSPMLPQLISIYKW